MWSSPSSRSMRRAGPALCALVLLAACAPGADSASGDSASGDSGPLVVFTAGSLARPMRAALDAFSSASGVAYELESAGSLETARKLTELHKIPDLVALADEEVFPSLLLPQHTAWYLRFARNRLVLAYTARSRHASELAADNWFEILQRPGVQTGRSNPDLDPAGYRTLMLFQLAERHYRRPGLAVALEEATPSRFMRPKEIELVALLEAAELDYAWFYESMARAAGLPYLRLPDAVDLGTPADSATYATAAVRVLGKTRGDTILLRGAPIVYAFSVPEDAPHRPLGLRFARFLLTEAGQRALASEFLEPMAEPSAVGRRIPAEVQEALGEGARSPRSR